MQPQTRTRKMRPARGGRTRSSETRQTYYDPAIRAARTAQQRQRASQPEDQEDQEESQ